MKSTPGPIQKFFDAVAREEIASLRGFMTAYLCGTMNDNPYKQQAQGKVVSNKELTELKSAWVRGFWQAQNYIMDASTAMAVLDYVGCDPRDYLSIIGKFEEEGILPTRFVVKFEHYADLKMSGFAAVA
jgi:hypothetical protein